MPIVPKLDQAVELRFYRQSGMSSRTIYVRREAKTVEYGARGLGGGPVTRRERVRFLARQDVEIEDALTRAEVVAPVRIVDSGIEYQVSALEDFGSRTRIRLLCDAFPPSQR